MKKIDKSSRKVINRAIKKPDIILKVLKEKWGVLLYDIRSKLIWTTRKDLLRYPVIYVRTPKCGSSAIVKSIQSYRGIIEVKRFDVRSLQRVFNESNLKKKVIVINASRAKWFSDQFPDIWSRSFKWTVVRNPYKRAVSSWRFLENLRNRSLVDVLKNPPVKPADGKYDRDYVHFSLTLTELLTVNHSLYPDRILRFESLDTEFSALNEELGMKIRKLPKVNVNLSSSEKFSLEPEAKVLLERHFNQDFLNFNYQIE